MYLKVIRLTRIILQKWPGSRQHKLGDQSLGVVAWAAEPSGVGNILTLLSLTGFHQMSFNLSVP